MAHSGIDEVVAVGVPHDHLTNPEKFGVSGIGSQHQPQPVGQRIGDRACRNARPVPRPAGVPRGDVRPHRVDRRLVDDRSCAVPPGKMRTNCSPTEANSIREPGGLVHVQRLQILRDRQSQCAVFNPNRKVCAAAGGQFHHTLCDNRPGADGADLRSGEHNLAVPGLHDRLVGRKRQRTGQRVRAWPYVDLCFPRGVDRERLAAGQRVTVRPIKPQAADRDRRVDRHRALAADVVQEPCDRAGTGRHNAVRNDVARRNLAGPVSRRVIVASFRTAPLGRISPR